MAEFLIQEAALFRLDEIYRYTLTKCGSKKAEVYIEGLFDAFSKVGDKGQFSRPIPAEFGVDGFYFKYQKHVVYWKNLSHGIVAILHERMHQLGQFKELEG